jgi:hypothetical protein
MGRRSDIHGKLRLSLQVMQPGVSGFIDVGAGPRTCPEYDQLRGNHGGVPLLIIAHFDDSS